MATAAVVLAAGALLPAPAGAHPPSRSPLPPFKLGGYSGTTSQQIPRYYRGKIHFTAQRDSITALSFTVRVLCNGLWASDSDSVPHFKAEITHSGTFSYNGTTAGRRIRLKGLLKAGLATGTFSQSFLWGHKRCAMGQRATFMATR